MGTAPYLGGRKKLALITKLFCLYMEPLSYVSRGKTGEADTEKRDWTKPLSRQWFVCRVSSS
jgi:hypothetical protein